MITAATAAKKIAKSASTSCQGSRVLESFMVSPGLQNTTPSSMMRTQVSIPNIKDLRAKYTQNRLKFVITSRKRKHEPEGEHERDI